MSSREKYITITHFINPHRFWYSSTDEDAYVQVEELENELTKLYRNDNKPYKFLGGIGSHIAVHFLTTNKFIRARVEMITSEHRAIHSYILWAIDHGFPFEASEKDIRPLPETYCMPISCIYFGGIKDVVPTSKSFDFVNMCRINEIKSKWCNRACESLERILFDAALIAFVEDKQSDTGQFWGDLLITNHRGKTFRGSDYLVKNENVALRSKNKFYEMQIEFVNNLPPVWLTNNGIINYRKNIYNIPVNYYRQKTQSYEKEIINAQKKFKDWNAKNNRASKHIDNQLEQVLESNNSFSYCDSDKSLSQFHNCKKNVKISDLPPEPSLEDFQIKLYTLKEDTIISDVRGNELHSSSLIPSINSSSKHSFKSLKMTFPKCNEEDIETSPAAEQYGEKMLVKDLKDFGLSARSDNFFHSGNKNCSETDLQMIGKTSESGVQRLLPMKSKKSIVKEDKIANRIAVKKEPKNEKHSPRKIHIIPAGYDLIKLNTYNDKNHWHLKNLTRKN